MALKEKARPFTDEQARAICKEAGIDVEAATARVMALVRSYHPCDACGQMTKAAPDPASGIILCGCRSPSSDTEAGR
jgi:multimeric flavodoxin WrbA